MGRNVDPGGQITSSTSPLTQAAGQGDTYYAVAKNLFDAGGRLAHQDLTYHNFYNGGNEWIVFSQRDFFYDGDLLIGRDFYDGQDDLSTFYVWGPTGPVLQCWGGTFSSALLYDPQGSLVNGIANGTFEPPPYTWQTADTKLAPLSYDAYGLLVWPVTLNVGWWPAYMDTPFKYKGQVGYCTDSDNEGSDTTGLSYCLNRFYDPYSGRWLSRDPVGLEGGVNVYGYCDGNPVMGADPSGLDAILIVRGEGWSGHQGETATPEWEKELTADYVGYYKKSNDIDIITNPTLKQLQRIAGKYDDIIFIGHGNETWGRLRGKDGSLSSLAGPDKLTPEGLQPAKQRGGKKFNFIILESCNMLQYPATRRKYLGLARRVVGYPGHEYEPSRHKSFPGPYAPGFPATYGGR